VFYEETAVVDRQYQLVVHKGPQPGQVYLLLVDKITIGRDPMSDIVLNDPEVSRHHAQLIRTEAGYQIQDLGSTNGTYIDKMRLGDELALLEPGQEVMLGSGISLRYQVAGGEAGAEAPFDMPLAAETAEGGPPDFEPSDFLPVQERPSPPRRQTAQPGAGAYRAPRRPPPPPLDIPANDRDNGQRRNIIIASAVLLLLCCCCAFVIFMYQYGGDWLLRQLGVIP
jgi:hypothetical protein